MHSNDFGTLITHPERDVRLRAAMDAGTLLDPRVTATLVSRVGVEEDFHVREYITWALVQHGDQAIPAVLELLTSANPLERQQAAHVLSKVGDPAHVTQLVAVVADEDADVAIKAYRAAASTGSRDVVEPLVARLGDGDGGQRDALSNALQQLGVLSVPALIAALGDSDTSVRLHAAEALGHIGEDAHSAIPALVERVDDGDADVALAVVMALGAVGGQGAQAALVDIAASGRRPLDAVARRLVRDPA